MVGRLTHWQTDKEIDRHNGRHTERLTKIYEGTVPDKVVDRHGNRQMDTVAETCRERQ